MVANFNSGVFTKVPAWHGMGVVVDEAPNSAEAMRLAGMDWEVGKTPVLYNYGGEILESPSHFVVTRHDTGAFLGIVGKQYRHYQNAEAFDFTDALVADGSMVYESAGVLGKGEKIWLLARMPGTIEVTGKGDTLQPYVMLLNGHDGSSSIHFGPTTVRIVCQNTWSMALAAGREQRNIWTIKHTAKLESNLQDARRAFESIHKLAEKTGQTYRELAKRQISRNQFETFAHEIVDITYPKKENEVEQSKPVTATPGVDLLSAAIEQTVAEREGRGRAAQNMLDYILAAYDSPEQTDTGAAGTAWAAFNTVTEYTSHGMQFNARGGDTTGRVQNEARFMSTFGANGKGAKINETAYELVMKRFK